MSTSVSSQLGDRRAGARGERAGDDVVDCVVDGFVDVFVIGAGTAGAAAAALCAERGLRVVCADRRPLADAGARWVNGVPARAFDDAGIPQPAGHERRGADVLFHLIAGRGPARVAIADHGSLEVDMRHLVARLQARARAAGAVLLGEVDVRVSDTEVWARGLDETGDERRWAPRWVVDASGLAGVRLLDQPPVAASDLCAAAQEVRAVTDVAAARAFFAERGAAPGEILCFTGVAGGYSIVNVRMDGDGDDGRDDGGAEVSLLTGSIPALGHPSGKALLDRFVADHSWIGPRRFGGARAIPLRRPYDRLTDGRAIAIGDAACQVFSAHGSGIGAGLVAARVLADALADGRGAHGYAVAWHRAHGGLLAASDAFRRFSQTLEVADLEAMIAAGLLDADSARAGMAQVFPRLGPRQVARTLVAAARVPRLAARACACVARMAAARALYARYPSDPARLPRWSRAIARVFGDAPDVR